MNDTGTCLGVSNKCDAKIRKAYFIIDCQSISTISALSNKKIKT